MGKSKIITVILLIVQIIIISNTNNYLETLKIDYSKINSVNSTVVISESRDIGTCTCDLTPNTCDYLCCCDIECPSDIINTWLDDPNNICLDKKNLDNNYLTHCFNENILYHFNRKRGMKEYRDPVSNLFCVTFDNSSIMGQFYKDIQNLQASTINNIYQNYVDKHLSYYYYFKQNTGVAINKVSYEVDDYIMAMLVSKNTLIFDGKFFTYQSGVYGDCVKTSAVKFMRPNEKVKYSCESNSWSKLSSRDYVFADSPRRVPIYLPIQINKVLIRDYETQTLAVWTGDKLDETKLIKINNNDCICNNMLEVANYNFIVDPNKMVLNSVYLDIILAVNVKGKCKEKFILNQTYSTKFPTSLSNFQRSGSPGYLTGYKLLIGYNSTDAQTGSLIFEVPKEGLYMVGKSQDNTCLSSTNNSDFRTINSFFDTPINYGVNAVYSCEMKYDLSSFESFCKNSEWKNLKIYKFPLKIQYIGTFGNANIEYKKDWTEVIFDYDLDKPLWDATYKSCKFPNTIILDVLTSKAGAVNNPQEYVVSARISAKYEVVKFESASGGNKMPIRMSFITNYIKLTEEIINTARNFPSMLPGLPSDIVKPLTSA